MSVDSTAVLLAQEPARRQARMPRRFFFGTLALYALVLGTFLLTLSPFQHSLPNIHTVVPTLAGISFYVAGNLFLLILGRGQVSRWVVLSVILTTFLLASALDLMLRSRL